MTAECERSQPPSGHRAPPSPGHLDEDVVRVQHEFRWLQTGDLFGSQRDAVTPDCEQVRISRRCPFDYATAQPGRVAALLARNHVKLDSRNDLRLACPVTSRATSFDRIF